MKWIIVFIFAVIAIIIADQVVLKVMTKRSQKVSNLLNINKNTVFKNLQESYNVRHMCKSKRQLEKFNLDEYIIALIGSDDSYYFNIISNALHNKKEYEKYINQYNFILSTPCNDTNTKNTFLLWLFKMCEKYALSRKKLRKPITSPSINFKAFYTSPQGRNHYWKEEIYSFSDLVEFYNESIEMKTQRKTRQYQIRLERAKMTDSVRYDILRRDNFRCQLCGSSAKDGVKLHIDHIVPVSKGGLTERNNLRTLCDRCNMGKSDKIEE